MDVMDQLRLLQLLIDLKRKATVPPYERIASAYKYPVLTDTEFLTLIGQHTNQIERVKQMSIDEYSTMLMENSIRYRSESDIEDTDEYRLIVRLVNASCHPDMIEMLKSRILLME